MSNVISEENLEIQNTITGLPDIIKFVIQYSIECALEKEIFVGKEEVVAEEILHILAKEEENEKIYNSWRY